MIDISERVFKYCVTMNVYIYNYNNNNNYNNYCYYYSYYIILYLYTHHQWSSMDRIGFVLHLLTNMSLLVTWRFPLEKEGGSPIARFGAYPHDLGNLHMESLDRSLMTQTLQVPIETWSAFYLWFRYFTILAVCWEFIGICKWIEVWYIFCMFLMCNV